MNVEQYLTEMRIVTYDFLFKIFPRITTVGDAKVTYFAIHSLGKYANNESYSDSGMFHQIIFNVSVFSGCRVSSCSTRILCS